MAALYCYSEGFELSNVFGFLVDVDAKSLASTGHWHPAGGIVYMSLRMLASENFRVECE